MNLNQKEKLKQKLDDLEALLSCIDQSWFISHSTMNVSQIAAAMFSHIGNIGGNDDFVTMSILLRMVKFQIAKIKMEIEL